MSYALNEQGRFDPEYAEVFGVPFTPPKTGRFAVKVINDHGHEVLKVYSG